MPPADHDTRRLVLEMRDNAVLLGVTTVGTAALLAIGAAAGQANWPVYLAVTWVGLLVAGSLHLRFGFSPATRIGLALRGRLGPASDDRVLAATIVVLAACAFGAVNEIIEWVMTLTIPNTDVGGYDNTARDLVANLVGGLVMAGWTSRRSS